MTRGDYVKVILTLAAVVALLLGGAWVAQQVAPQRPLAAPGQCFALVGGVAFVQGGVVLPGDYSVTAYGNGTSWWCPR